MILILASMGHPLPWIVGGLLLVALISILSV